MKQTDISVIVPVYKVEEPLLRRCIDSLLAQTLKDIEILLIDDGCPEKGGAICDEYARQDGRIRVIHRANGGVSAARNDGLEAATGRYIAFVDGDDFVDPEYCRAMYTAAETTGADITICGADHYHMDTGVFLPFSSGSARVYRKEPELRQLTLSLLRSMRFRRDEPFLRINHFVWAHLYRTERIRELRFNRQFLRGEDKFFNFQALECCRVFCSVPGIYYHYVVNPRSLSRSFQSNAPDLALATYRYYRHLPRVEQDSEYRQAHYIRTCCMAIQQATTYFYHPDNPDKSPVAAFRRFCREDVVAEAIEKADIRDMRLCKMKLAILCLKKRMYGPAAELARRFGL